MSVLFLKHIHLSMQEVKKVKVDYTKLEIAKARSCMGRKEIEIAGIPHGTYSNIRSGKDVKATTVHKLIHIHIMSWWKVQELRKQIQI